MCDGSSSESSGMEHFMHANARSEMYKMRPSRSTEKIRSGWDSKTSANRCNRTFSVFKSPIMA